MRRGRGREREGGVFGGVHTSAGRREVEFRRCEN